MLPLQAAFSYYNFIFTILVLVISYLHSLVVVWLCRSEILAGAYLGGGIGLCLPLDRQDSIISIEYCSMQNCGMAPPFVIWAKALSKQMVGEDV